MSPTVPILLYHHVSPERDMTPVRFESQLRWIQDQGYSTLTMDDLVSGLQRTTRLPGKAIVITFDDGYLNNWLHAFPVLQKLQMKVVIYLVTDKIGTEGFLSWEQVKAMTESGLVTIGSHTRSHRGFVRKKTYQNVDDELKTSKETIERELGVACRHLAWPWGDYETEWLSRLQQLGYASAATTLGGANAPGSSPLELRRITVRRWEIPWLAARLGWHSSAAKATLFGLFYGWDRRFKVWKNSESPYAHG